MGSDIVTLTLVHVALSMLAIFAGLVVNGGFIMASGSSRSSSCR
jgi:hypothetical protein